MNDEGVTTVATDQMPAPPHDGADPRWGTTRPRRRRPQRSVVFSVKDLAVYYGTFRAVRDVHLDVASTRSRRSSARRAAARPRCCAASTG